LRRQRSGGSRFKASSGKTIHEILSQKLKHITKKGSGVAETVGPEFKPQYLIKEK
jgi:hypothetical protein